MKKRTLKKRIRDLERRVEFLERELSTRVTIPQVVPPSLPFPLVPYVSPNINTPYYTGDPVPPIPTITC